MRHSPQKICAKQYLDKPEAFWEIVLWTDEVKMELFDHNHQKFGGKKGSAFVEKNTLPAVQYGGGFIMLWGCVAATGTRN